MKRLLAEMPYTMRTGYRVIRGACTAIALMLLATTTVASGDAQHGYLAQARSADQTREGPPGQESKARRLCGSDEGKFKRVTTLPEGEQINPWTSGFLSGFDLSNSVETVCAASESQVWDAAKKASEQVHRIGKRPVAGRDEKTRRIQNGKIRQDAALGAGAGAWMDEILIEVTPSATDGSSKVVVSRRIVKAIAGRRERQWRTAKSNGEIEAWVLTQIEDALAAPVARVDPEPVAGTAKEEGLRDDAESRLRRLQDLRDKNLIGEDEYQAMRRRVLEGIVAPASTPK